MQLERLSDAGSQIIERLLDVIAGEQHLTAQV